MLVVFFFFFFKQKTAYEMRISDWSSDVCSSDLHRLLNARGLEETMLLGADTVRPLLKRLVPDAEFQARPRLSTLSYAGPRKLARLPPRSAGVAFSAADVYTIAEQIGSAACRERGCQYV